MTTKKLTRSSAITIPKELRTKLGWGTGIAIDIEAVGDGSLVIRPHVDRSDTEYAGQYGAVIY